MYGIDLDIIDKIIKVNNLNIEDLKGNIKNIKETINNLDNCFSGNSINFLSTKSQINNFDKILKVCNSYVDVLSNVKDFYIAEEQKIANIVNAINSRK